MPRVLHSVTLVLVHCVGVWLCLHVFCCVACTDEESVQYFAIALQQEAERRGFDPIKDGETIHNYLYIYTYLCRLIRCSQTSLFLVNTTRVSTISYNYEAHVLHNLR